MNKSESIINLAKAMLNAQRKMGAAAKDSKNPFFKSKFADYGSVLEVVKGPLNEEGIVVLQPHSFSTPYTNDTGVKNYVDTVLVHESGEWLSSSTEVVCAKPNDPQALGSAITYARRYGLQSMLSIPAEDNDAEGAMNREPKKIVQEAKPNELVDTPKPNPWRKPKPSDAKPTEVTTSSGMEF